MTLHECIGRATDDLIKEYDPDYLIFFRQGIYGELDVEELQSFSPGRVTILGGHELVALRRLDSGSSD